MYLKSKVFAIAVAGLLGLGVAAGSALADQTTSGVTITLNGGTTTCSAALQNTSFGTYNYSGGKWNQDPNDPGSVEIAVSVNEAYGDSGDHCDVSAAIGQFFGPGGRQVTLPIPLDDGNGGTITLTSTAATLGTDLSNQGTYSWTIQDLSTALQAQMMNPGSYTATLTLTGTVTAP